MRFRFAQLGRVYRRLDVLLPPLAFFIIVLGTWKFASARELVDPLMLPSPESVLEELIFGFATGVIPPHLLVTLQQTLSALAIGVVAGVATAVAVFQSRALNEAVTPILLTVEAFPKIALAPLFITWFGYGMGSKIALAGTMAYFPVMISTLAGLAATPASQLDLFRSMSAGAWQTLLRLRLPYALPFILSGVNIAAIAALIGSIVGEFTGSREGIGTLILYANELIATDRVFALILILSLFGLSLHLLTQFARNRLTSWA